MRPATRQKTRIILNLILTVFTLLALIISMVAWFSNSQRAEIDSITLSVDNYKIEVTPPESYLFPCATKIAKVDKDAFNDNDCAIPGTYIVQGDIQLYVDVIGDPKYGAVLGYVLDNSESLDDIELYDTITSKIKTKLGVESLANVSTSQIKQALREINLSRKVGKLNSQGNTEITIVCWAEYESLDGELNQIVNGSYVYKNDIDFDVKVKFSV